VVLHEATLPARTAAPRLVSARARSARCGQLCARPDAFRLRGARAPGGL